jgi:hypothetical protein
LVGPVAPINEIKMDEIDGKRIKRLPAQVLLFERSDKDRQINKLQSDRKQWRGNPSDAGAISQMEALAKLEGASGSEDGIGFGDCYTEAVGDLGSASC